MRRQLSEEEEKQIRSLYERESRCDRAIIKRFPLATLKGNKAAEIELPIAFMRSWRLAMRVAMIRQDLDQLCFCAREYAHWHQRALEVLGWHDERSKMKVLSVPGFSVRADQIIYIGEPFGVASERYRHVIVQGGCNASLSESLADEIERQWKEAVAPVPNIPLVPEKEK